MKEIWVPEALATLFLAIPLLRPFIERLRPLDGIAWLPLIALGILAAIFPAYGFRPEVVPMLILALCFNIANLSSLVASFAGRGDARERGPLGAIAAMVLILAAAVPMFVFAPSVHAGHERGTEGVASFAVPVGFHGGGEYVLRVYGPVLASRPVVFVVPPELGAAASVELVCERLMKKGFTVVTYFRRDYDTLFVDADGRRRPAPAKLLRNWRAFRRGTELASANELGRRLEAARKADLEFLLPRLPALLGLDARDEPPPILFVGYGAGGSALAFMAGEDGLLARHGALGVVAIESRLWSSYAAVPRHVEPFTDTGTMYRLRTNVVNWFHGIGPQRVSRTGSLPEAGLPVLYVVSGRALEAGRRQRPYRAVFDALDGPGPSALIAVESSGPLDFQDFPLTQPLLSFFLPGLRGAGRSGNPVGDTAGIIGNVASLLLERRLVELDARLGAGRPEENREGENFEPEPETELEPETPAGREIDIPPRSSIGATLRVETRGLELRL